MQEIKTMMQEIKTMMRDKRTMTEMIRRTTRSRRKPPSQRSSPLLEQTWAAGSTAARGGARTKETTGGVRLMLHKERAMAQNKIRGLANRKTTRICNLRSTMRLMIESVSRFGERFYKALVRIFRFVVDFPNDESFFSWPLFFFNFVTSKTWTNVSYRHLIISMKLTCSNRQKTLAKANKEVQNVYVQQNLSQVA